MLHFLNQLIVYTIKSHLSRPPYVINTMYVTTWPINKRGNKWEMLSYEAWTDRRTTVCHNKPVCWRAYKNEWPISWNYEYIIFGQIIFQNIHQFKAFVGLSDCRIIATAPKFPLQTNIVRQTLFNSDDLFTVPAWNYVLFYFYSQLHLDIR
jgi:hypothetical protein